MNPAPLYVRCKDNTLVRQLLTIGRVYECAGAQDDNYFVMGKWLTKGRFAPATYLEWAEQQSK